MQFYKAIKEIKAIILGIQLIFPQKELFLMV